MSSKFYQDNPINDAIYKKSDKIIFCESVSPAKIMSVYLAVEKLPSYLCQYKGDSDLL